MKPTNEIKTDIYQKITESIIASMESAAQWQKPWTVSVANGLPVNAVSKKTYRGVNVLTLWATAQDKQYASTEWATYRQWSELGAQVRKGEKATAVVFWSSAKSKKESQDGEDKTFLFAKSYSVFNASQVDNYKPADVPVPVSTNARIAAVDDWFSAIGAVVRHGSNGAFYRPLTDTIDMPDFESFNETGAYYSTLAHEHIHWTSREIRCNRELGKRFGDAQYAVEELIAELGSAFTCAHLGISCEPRADHASYLKSWLTVLKNDKRAVFTAASKAQQAVDFLVREAEPKVQELAA